MAGSTSTTNQSASPAAAATTSGQDELYQALHSRLVTTGEWQRYVFFLSASITVIGEHVIDLSSS